MTIILPTWEDGVSRPAWANSSQDHISKITRKNELEVWLKQQSICFASAKP
jgi:hypothetical protein